MVRTRLQFRRKINDSSHLADKVANLSIKNKNMKKKNNGRIPLSPVFEIQRKAELAAKMKAEHMAKEAAERSKGFRPAIPLLLHMWVQEAVEVMNRPGHREDDADLKVAENKISAGCRIFSTLLPVGWKYQRENAAC